MKPPAFLRDLLLVLVLAVPPLVSVGTGPYGDLAFWGELTGIVIMAVAVPLRRRWPLGALLTVLALTAVHGNFVFAVPVVAYLTGVRMERAKPVIWLFAGVFFGGLVFNFIRGLEGPSALFLLMVYFAVLAVLPWLVGRYRRQYGELVAAGWERAEQLEREHRIVSERERARERARIAEDMHDSLGHELSLIALRAAALEVAADLPERHREAAGRLRGNAADATERLREIIGVLREDDAPLRPAGESVADLVERARVSGVEVGLEQEGPEPPLLVDRAVHRVVQEALTNATKHAPGAAVSVRIEGGDEETLVRVVNERPPAGPLPGRIRGLTGLTALRERVTLTGGAFEAGPTDEGGFAVTARLPHGAHPVPSEISESATRLAGERARMRREMWTALWVPLGLIAVFSSILAIDYAIEVRSSVLRPADYAKISVGQSQGEAEALLPHEEMPNPPRGSTRAGCGVYRSDGNLLGFGTVYRVCFEGGRVSEKTTIGEK
ncbi:sensor histidine kinase [Actinocorallia longicatena]|uniref:histidine kinase n=1 Tax=Actinocorallia longicatena TaxID=111803 RepID=A0ABP6QBP9_9ACTN